MSAVTPYPSIASVDVEVLSKRDGKLYELVDGELKEKLVGTHASLIAVRICERLNAAFYLTLGYAVTESVIYCFGRPDHGRRPDAYFIRLDRIPDGQVPSGDLHVAPDLVVEVLSPGNSAIELEAKLDEYLDAGVAMVWIVNPEGRTIRAYRSNGTTRLYRANDVIENESILPGFKMVVEEVFRPPMSAAVKQS